MAAPELPDGNERRIATSVTEAYKGYIKKQFSMA